MAQVKIYGARAHLDVVRERLSETIHAAAREVLGLPADKRFHRFIALAPEDFLYPPDRGPAYTIIEISMFEGRDAATRKALLQRLMAAEKPGKGRRPRSCRLFLSAAVAGNRAARAGGARRGKPAG